MMWCHLVALSAIVGTVWSHGRVLEPPSRASAWRVGYPTAPDYDDDGVNCGGFSMQWSVNRGKCGICGDAYHIAPPRPHELGGVYGQGVIVGHYLPGSLITMTVDLTTSHRGFWEVKLCPDPEINKQYCFDQHTLELEDGGPKYYPTRGSVKYNVTYRLPQGLVCEHCVLQWRYTAGNNWGDCRNGTSALGCGNQEQFGACSDISIGMTNDRGKEFTELNQIPYPLFYYLKHGYFDVQQVMKDHDKDEPKSVSPMLRLLHLLRKGYVRPSDQERTRLTDQGRTKARNKPTDQGRTRLNDQSTRFSDQGHDNARTRPPDQGHTRLPDQGRDKMRIKPNDQGRDKTRSKFRYKNKKGRRKKKKRAKSGRKLKPRKRKKVTYEYWR